MTGKQRKKRREVYIKAIAFHCVMEVKRQNNNTSRSSSLSRFWKAMSARKIDDALAKSSSIRSSMESAKS